MKEDKEDKIVGGEEEQLTLSTWLMKMTLGLGKSRHTDNLLYPVLISLLSSKVTDKKLYGITQKMPEEMSMNEARDKYRRDISTSKFPYVEEMIGVRDGIFDDIIAADYHRKLQNLFNAVIRDLEVNGKLPLADFEGKDKFDVYK